MSDSKAPEMIWVPPHLAADLGVCGCGICDEDGDIAYIRADLPWLPEHLLRRLMFFADFDDAQRYDLLRDILAAVEQKENEE